MPSPNAPMAQAGQQGFGLDGPEPRVRPLQPLRPLHGLISASRPHGGQRVPQGRHSERHCDGIGSNLRLLLHRDIKPDGTRCPERSPAENSTVHHLLLSATRRLVTPAAGPVRDGVFVESRVAKAVWTRPDDRCARWNAPRGAVRRVEVARRCTAGDVTSREERAHLRATYL